MVLELLTGPKRAEKNPAFLLIYGFIYSTIAVFLSMWIFREQATLIIVFLTVLAAIPLVHRTLIFEEQKDLEIQDEPKLLKQHSKALIFLLSLFLGSVIAFSFWFIVLPHDTVSSLFASQLSTIKLINSQVTGNVTAISLLSNIISNNLRVLFFTLFFSFFYGAGAIFILIWNASVISAAIGNYIRSNLGIYASHLGLAKAAGYFQVVSVGLLRYMTHGLLEILAYFIAAFAGGLISIAAVRHSIGDENFNRIMLDASILVAIAIGVILVAGVVEIYITPALF